MYLRTGQLYGYLGIVPEELMFLISLAGVVRQAGHTDAAPSVKGDTALSLCLSSEPRRILMWIIRDDKGKYVGYHEAVSRGGIEMKVAGSCPILVDDESTYALAEGWTMAAKTVDIPRVICWCGTATYGMLAESLAREAPTCQHEHSMVGTPPRE
jgi:hypothetical protein